MTTRPDLIRHLRAHAYADPVLGEAAEFISKAAPALQDAEQKLVSNPVPSGAR